MSITLLDGGMGQEVYRRSGKPAHPLWSLTVMMENPEIVQDLHLEFIEAGAEVITINAYTATPFRLERDGYSDWFKPAQAKAIELAKAARDVSDKDVRVAGCLPPIRASYRPDENADFAKTCDEYRTIVAEQADHVDLIQCETMASITEARAACTAAAETGLPVWVGLTMMDDGTNRLRSGEPLSEALDVLDGLGAAAILLNCSIPEAVNKGIPLIHAAGHITGGYANGFTSIAALESGGTVETLEARKDLTPEIYADLVAQWIDAGASIVGGCCEVGPAHIAELNRRFK